LGRASRVLIAGGYGVFGRLIAAELLARTSAHLLIAGRDLRAAARACRRLDSSGRCEPLRLDLSDQESVRRAVSGCFALVCAAGPFQRLDRRGPQTVAAAGAHWLDIGDDTAWVLSLLEKGGEASRGSATAILPGLSTTPALSGVLVRWLYDRLPDARTARITLFIGNRNRKGPGSVASALDSELDCPMTVDLPVGRYVSHRLGSADAALLAKELRLEAEFRVAFKWGISRMALARVHALALSSARSARLLSLLSEPLRFFGTDTGCVEARLWNAAGESAAAWFLARGQRLAALPAVIALEALMAGEIRPRGAFSPAQLFPPQEWIARLNARGIDFGSRPGDDYRDFPT
jgi:hypothetical protein